MYHLMLYRLPLIMVIATACRNTMLAYNCHLNIEILSRLFLLLCRLKMYDQMLYRLPLIMVTATADRNTSVLQHVFVIENFRCNRRRISKLAWLKSLSYDSGYCEC